ncbi:hypothetical protein BPORC_1846 [Bifidobacterium porcinum]|nr:hypothetical protein BPORC_1846 [Bifidobacterium porcinum]
MDSHDGGVSGCGWWVGLVACGCVRIGSHSGGQRDGQAAPATPAAAHRSLRPAPATPVAIPSLPQPPIALTPTIPAHPTSVSHLRRAQSSAKLLTLRKVCHIAGMLTVKKRPRTAYSGRPPAFPGNKRQSER